MLKCSVCESQLVPPFVLYCVTCWNRLNRRYKISVDEFREYISVSYRASIPYWATPYVSPVYWHCKSLPQCPDMPGLAVILEKIMFLKVAGIGYCGTVDEYNRRRGFKKQHRAGSDSRPSRIRRTEQLNRNTRWKSMRSISLPTP